MIKFVSDLRHVGGFHYVIKFVSDLQHVGGFHYVIKFVSDLPLVTDKLQHIMLYEYTSPLTTA